MAKLRSTDVNGNLFVSGQLKLTNPFLISTDKLITNLNADLLDGKHADDLAIASQLGYYDTITENDDGTYTITRQTGYLVLDGVENKFEGKSGTTSNGIYTTGVLANYIEKPSSNSVVGNIISNLFKTYSYGSLYNNNLYGIAIINNGYFGIGLTTSISTLEDANAWLSQNPTSIQYKLATATTEKVEKNHYARYNQNFILEHNKSEAERSANLLELINITNNVNGTNVNISNGTITVSGTSSSSGGRNNKLSKVFSLEPGTYYFKAFGNITSSPCLSKIDTSFLMSANSSITITEPTQVYFGINVNANTTYNESYQLMLVKGSTPPTTYQPYEGKVIHEKDLLSASVKTAGTADYFKYGRGVMLADSTSFTNNFNKDIFGEETADKFHLVELRTQGNAPSCLLGNHSSGIAWKGADTYGSLMVRWGYPQIRVSGGNGNNSNPKWTVDLIHSNNISSESIKYATVGLGRYDTITENSDGTFTINRQTGYILLDGVIEKNASVVQNGSTSTYRYTFDIVNGYGADGPVISNLLTNISFSDLSNNGRTGIAMYSPTRCSICISGITKLEDYKSHLAKNNIYVQYKLATATSEKVEKNHYARYNERFILEHNRTEAERSCNLLDVPNKTITDGDITFTISNGVINVNGSSAASTYPKCPINSVELQAGTYTINKSVNNNGLFIWVGSNPLSNDIVNTNGIGETFTITTNMRVYIAIVSTQSQTYSNFKFSLMLNEGTKALPYQPYNQNKHITNNEALFLKNEAERSANLLNIDDVASTTTNGITYSIKDGVITLNGTATDNVLIKALCDIKANQSYYLKIFDSPIKLRCYYSNDVNTPFGTLVMHAKEKLFTPTTDAKCLNIWIWKDDTINSNIKPMLVEGSTSPITYRPYNQNKHITNNEAVFLKNEAERSANVFDKDLTSLIYGTGYEVPTTATDWVKVYQVPVKGSTRYSSNKTMHVWGSSDGVTYTHIGDSLTTFTTASNTKYLCLCIYVGSNASEKLSRQTFNDLMLNEGSVALPYQPYEGKVIHEKDLKNVSTNLGYYDTMSENDDGTFTITRQTGYLTINTEDITRGSNETVNEAHAYVYAYISKKVSNALYDWDAIIGISNNGFEVKCVDSSWIGANKISINSTANQICIGFSSPKTQAEIQALCPIYVQYKLATATTEKVEKNYCAQYNKRFILEHNKSEANKSANLLNTFDRSNIPSDSSLYRAILNSDGSYTGSDDINSDRRSWAYVNSDFKLHLTKGTYTFSVTGTISTNEYTQMELFDSNNNLLCGLYRPNNFKNSFALTNDADIGILIKSYNSKNLKIMLNEGTEPLPYQPYKGKIVHENDLKNVSTSLGYYDEVTENIDGTYTITRQTGFRNISIDLFKNGKYRTTQNGHGEYGADTDIHNLPILSGFKNFINNLLTVRDNGEVYAGSTGISISDNGMCWVNLGDDYTTTKQYREYFSKNNIYVQYKLATATTEKIEKNNYGRYNERFILEHNESEAEEAINLFDLTNITDDSNYVNPEVIFRYEYGGLIIPCGTETGTNNVELQKFKNNGYVSYLGGFAEGFSSITFQKTSDFNQIRIKRNGSKKDYGVLFNVDYLEDGKTYTISAKVQLRNDTNDKKIFCFYIMIVEGTKAPSNYCHYNAKKHISNSEVVYLKNNHRKFGNLWQSNKNITFNSGDNKWVYFDHKTLLSWGLKEGKVYTFKPFNFVISDNTTIDAQYVTTTINTNGATEGDFQTITSGYTFIFTSTGYIRIGKDTLGEYVSFTPKITLVEGDEALTPYQPYCAPVINHFLKISFTKGSITYNCRVNILSTVRTAITSFDTFAEVCRAAKNIFETSASETYYWSMPAEGSNDNGSYSDNYIIFRLFLYFDYAGEKIIYLYNINKTNTANNFTTANSVGADVYFTDTVTTIYGE